MDKIVDQILITRKYRLQNICIIYCIEFDSKYMIQFARIIFLPLKNWYLLDFQNYLFISLIIENWLKFDDPINSKIFEY